MKKMITLIALGTFTGLAAQFNMNLLGTLDYQALHNSDLSDIWGYVDEDGNEYALVGVNDGGLSIVDLSDPTNPTEIFYAPGVSSTWRDVKVWNDHAYMTTEGSGGSLLIVDLSPLPQSNALTTAVYQGNNWDTSHNIYIDGNGICYIMGANRGNGGVIFLDLTQDPMAPVEIGEFDTWYVHDGMARGDTLYSGHVYEGFFSIVDVSDKSAPVVLGTQSTGNNFTHNCWVSDDGDHLFTTDEVSGGYIGSYDISDPSDIQELQLIQSQPGSGTIPHNTHFINDYIVTSYYRYGTTIHDVSRPANVIEVGNYDSSPLSGNGFNGAWGTYPFLPSGLIITSDIEGGLFVFGPTYSRACWLEGTVTNASTNAPIMDVDINILGPSITSVTAFDGSYATGYHTAGSYDVLFYKPGYQSTTETGVSLTNAVVTQLDVQLQPLTSFTFQGTAQDAMTGTPVSNAQVLIQNNDFTYTATTQGNGQFSIPGFFDGTYNVTVGAWGWITTCMNNASLNSATPPLVVELDQGLYDDFTFDFGWTVSTNATTGAWERGDPVGTTSGPAQSNPEDDVNGDCGTQAYVTGNGGGGAGNDDVDDGSTMLISPIMDMSTMPYPRMEFYSWFFNAGGQSPPNDDLWIGMTNGTDTATLAFITAATANMSTWEMHSFDLLSHLTLSSTMQLLVRASDIGDGHLVEAGLDVFRVIPDSTTNIAHSGSSSTSILLFPNPNKGEFSVVWNGHDDPFQGQLFDATGRTICSFGNLRNGAKLLCDLDPGIYWLQVQDERGARLIEPMVVR